MAPTSNALRKRAEDGQQNTPIQDSGRRPYRRCPPEDPGCDVTHTDRPETTSASESSMSGSGDGPGNAPVTTNTELSQNTSETDTIYLPSSTLSDSQMTATSPTGPTSTASSISSTSDSHKSSSHIGPIVGGVVGGVVGLALIALLAFFLLRRRRNRRAARGAPSSEFMYHPAVRARSVTPLVGGRIRPQRVDSDQEALYHASQRDTIEINGSEQELPPPFTTGSFRDPVLEKAEASSRFVDQMHARDAEMRQRDSV